MPRLALHESPCLTVATLVAVVACTARPPVRTVLPPVEPGDTSSEAGYEAPPVLRASEVLAGGLREGPHHRVSERVETDGFIRIYRIESDFGDLEAHGDDVLRERVREIEAVAVLRETGAGEQFARAAAKALQSPFVATWNLITKPVDSIVGVPVGAFEFLRRSAELARSERGELEDSAVEEFVGFEARKREIAHRLGVDPYSSNPVLQRELNRFAWASYVGGFPAMFVPFRGARRATEADSSEPGRLEEILLVYAPEDLRRLNRIELAVMGIAESERDAFIGHPWYSPRHQTLLVASLSALEGTRDRRAFIEVALSAGSEADALFFQRVAQLLRAYGERVRPIERLVVVDGTVGGLTDDGRLVVPLLVDYAAWTRPAHDFAQALLRPATSRPPVRRTELLLSGTLTPRARDQMERRGIEVVEHAFERLSAGGDGGAGEGL